MQRGLQKEDLKCLQHLKKILALPSVSKTISPVAKLVWSPDIFGLSEHALKSNAQSFT